MYAIKNTMTSIYFIISRIYAHIYARQYVFSNVWSILMCTHAYIVWLLTWQNMKQYYIMNYNVVIHVLEFIIHVSLHYHDKMRMLIPPKLTCLYSGPNQKPFFFSLSVGPFQLHSWWLLPWWRRCVKILNHSSLQANWKAGYRLVRSCISQEVYHHNLQLWLTDLRT